MFSEDERTFSHGCIHAQEPARLAAWVLGDRRVGIWNGLSTP